jgi:A/G-specific adenine glycosylase
LITIGKRIVEWFVNKGRKYAWRETSDPYRIWLSEIMFQQTRIEQGLPFYEKFTEKWPTIFDLANASDDEIMKAWQGLGYYSRARNLIQTARVIVNEFDGEFPSSYEELLKLKGIGPYSAAAIASIAFGLDHAVVDGNVFRVLSRFYGDDTPIDSTAGKKKFSMLAQEQLPVGRAADYNQGLMDLGAIVCMPRNPACESCPLMADCRAFANGNPQDFPVKNATRKIKNRWFNYFIPEERLYLRKRNGGDIWRDLYEFPGFESQDALSQEEDLLREEANRYFGTGAEVSRKIEELSQLLSHQKIHATFWLIKNAGMGTDYEQLIKVNEDSIEDYAFPKVIDRYLQKNTLNL